ncbi:hypothetical protein HNR30_009052 [Nonomuraea soli]|uniref:Uncharacterized protein n=1 Tax=Nonomuraea soli TaxID=1032476 RepID=A0A7W0CUZ1_9ACTN|nr:hypothetical protein [Nonomuraea soli]
MVVAVLAGGPGVFAGVLLGRHWRAHRRAANGRSLFSP